MKKIWKINLYSKSAQHKIWNKEVKKQLNIVVRWKNKKKNHEIWFFFCFKEKKRTKILLNYSLNYQKNG